MNVLHISGSDVGGGSARSAMNLHRSLRSMGVGSRMYVARKGGDDPDVAELVRHRSLQLIERATGMIVDAVGFQYVFYPSSWWLRMDRWFRAADVIQLYNIHGGFFSLHALPWLSRAKPIVWRLSDMWPLTGHCAYSYSCDRWLTGCGRCPLLTEYPALRFDTTHLMWRLKKSAYRSSELIVVAPSRWIAGLAAKSPLLRHVPIHRIANGIDATTFFPSNKKEARRALGLKAETPVVLFVAGSLSEPRKGAAFVFEALSRLGQGRAMKPLLLLAGGGRLADESSVSVKYLGFERDESMLRLAYSAADVMVLPATAENLPNAILESMACETPVVAFDVGGVSDAVIHLETGYLAKAQDIDDLCAGVALILDNPERCETMGRKGAQLVAQEFELTTQTRRVVQLYDEIIQERHG